MKVPHIVAGCASSLGQQREHNEDCVFVWHNQTISEVSGEDEFGLFLLADGMGGYESGEIASRTAVMSFKESVMSWYLDKLNGRSPGMVAPEEMLENAMHAANRAVVSATPGGGTTLSAVLMADGILHIAHVGDTRVQFIPTSGEPVQLTTDHSLVQRLIEMGQLKPKDAMTHPQRNVLYRALGQTEPLRTDIESLALPGEGWLLISSDGLWGSLAQERLLHIVREDRPPQDACVQLCLEADLAGGNDNCSVILVRFNQSDPQGMDRVLA